MLGVQDGRLSAQMRHQQLQLRNTVFLFWATQGSGVILDGASERFSLVVLTAATMQEQGGSRHEAVAP
jgi:hypothetical protein